MRQIMRSSLDYAGFAQLCRRSPIMRAHNRIIPQSLLIVSHISCTYLSPIPVSSAVRSYLTSWYIQNSTSLIKARVQKAHPCSLFETNSMVLYGLYLPTVILTIIWYSITHSLYHSRLKTFLFCKSFPLQPFLSSS